MDNRGKMMIVKRERRMERRREEDRKGGKGERGGTKGMD